MPPWIPSQTRMRCKLGIQRIRQTIDKSESLAKRSRRDVAGLLEQGKIETASVRTEALILSDAHNELLELLELYLELILARFGLLDVPGGSSSSASSKEPDEGVREAVCAIVYAAPRSEIRELHIIREAFMSRFGRDWAISVMDNTHSHVPSRIVNKCKMTTPDKGYVEAYLVEIAKAYNLAWRPEGWVEVSEHLLGEEEGTAEARQRVLEAELSNASAGDDLRTASQAGDGEDDDDNDSGGGNLALPSTPSSAPKLNNVKSSTSSIPIIHPSSSTPQPRSQPDDPSAEDQEEDGSSILPAIPPTDPAQSERTVIIKTMSPQSKPAASLPPKPAPSAPAAQNGGSTAADDKRYDDLAKRFEALKRK